MKASFQVLSLAVFVSTIAAAQQVPDTEFHLDNPSPAYERGTGPQVCIDEAHFNFHTANGTYKPFAELLRSDGYQVRSFDSAFSQETMGECQILVIANALSEANSHWTESDWTPTDWAFPHPSALTREEISELVTWIRKGGSLFLIVDHAPWAGATSDLAIVLGVQMIDGEAISTADASEGYVLFGAIHDEQWRRAASVYGVPYEQFHPILNNAGTLVRHAIVKGRSQEEGVDSVVTFTGNAFYPSANVDPILVLGPQAVVRIPLEWNLDELSEGNWPQFPVGGWLQGGTLRLGEGRVAILGEAAMCSAQVEGPERMPMGINAPHASQNSQFCLNAVRWLSGLLDGA